MFVEIIQKEGFFRGFYNGLIPSIVLVSNPVIHWFLYEVRSDACRDPFRRCNARIVISLDTASDARTPITHITTIREEKPYDGRVV